MASQSIPLAALKYDLEGLLFLIPGENCEWIRQRATDAWPNWVKAGKKFEKSHQTYKKKTVTFISPNLVLTFIKENIKILLQTSREARRRSPS